MEQITNKLYKLPLNTKLPSKKPVLTYDIIYNILTFTNIGFVSSTICTIGSHLDKGSKQRLKDKRLDIAGPFEDLEIDIVKLIEAMHKYKVILSGSRALNYFVPGSSTPNSDYDFYIQDNTKNIIYFLIETSRIGVQWLADKSGTRDQSYINGGFNMVRGIVISNRGAKDIQLIWRKRCMATECLITFHSTAAQCFISSYGAVSLHHNLTSLNLSKEWCTEDTFHILGNSQSKSRMDEVLSEALNDSEFIEQTANYANLVGSINSEKIYYQFTMFKIRKKYESRNFKYIDNSDLLDSFVVLGKYGGIVRSMTDKYTCIVPNYTYLHNSLEHDEINAGIARLNYIVWIEMDNALIPINSPLVKMYPPHRRIASSIKLFDREHDKTLLNYKYEFIKHDTELPSIIQSVRLYSSIYVDHSQFFPC